MMSMPVVAVLLLLVVFVVVTAVRRGRTREGGRSFPRGPAGPVPMSSVALNAELIRRAGERLVPSDAAEIEAILNSVAREQYPQALSAIDRRLLNQEDEDQDVQVLLLWTKSNIFQRTQKVSHEIHALKELSAISSNPLFELNLAVAHSKLENYREAEAHYLKAIDLMGGRYPLASFNLGILYCKIGKRSSATEQLRSLQAFGRDVPQELVKKLQTRISEVV
jgi:tetratricopeptide (TPR) repeat protein